MATRYVYIVTNAKQNGRPYRAYAKAQDCADFLHREGPARVPALEGEPRNLAALLEGGWIAYGATDQFRAERIEVQ